MTREFRFMDKEVGAKVLTSYGVLFEKKNKGAHLIIHHDEGVFDFWPGTGRWVRRSRVVRGEGVYQLLQQLKINVSERLPETNCCGRCAWWQARHECDVTPLTVGRCGYKIDHDAIQLPAAFKVTDVEMQAGDGAECGCFKAR